MTKTFSDPELIRLRLRIARLKFGFLTLKEAADFIEAKKAVQLPDGRPLQSRSYMAYETGQRGITPTILKQLEGVFQVSPPGWLHRGGGETKDQLLDEVRLLESVRQLEKQQRSKSLLDRSPRLKALISKASQVNQFTDKSNIIDINPTNFVPVRRIPVLSGDDIARFVTGYREMTMTARAIAIPQSQDVSESCFGYVVPEHDTAMIGTGGISFPPGTEAVFDADQDVLPDNFLLIRLRGMNSWLFRQYQAGLPLSVAQAYTLRALNPDVEPIRVTDPENWEVAGRLISTNHKW